MGRDQEDEPLAHVLDHAAPLAQPVHQGGEGVIAEHEVGGLAGHLRPAAHRHRNIRAMQRRRVVDPVPGDRHGAPRGTRRNDQAQLLLGHRAGHDAHRR